MKHFFNRYYQQLIIMLSGITLICIIISCIAVSQGNFSQFEPELFFFGLPFGSFIWGDLFIFSLLWFVLCIMLLKAKNPRYFWIALCSFWLIRGVGETLYWFVQQFSPDHQPWINYYPRIFFLDHLKPEEIWVFHQVIWQAITILSLFGLIYTTILLIKEK